MTDVDIVTDAILAGRLRLRQPRTGHKAGTDAILLAAAADLRKDDRIVDVGAGVGTIGLALALREATLTGVLLEIDPATGALAGENCRLNGLDGRLCVAVADLFDRASREAAGLSDGTASLVVTNPPFLSGHESRPSPHPGRARAHSLEATDGRHRHGDWLRAASSLLAPKGRLHLIHRPDALPALLVACEGRLGALRIRPIFGKPGAPAIRIILSGVKGSRAPSSIEPALILHEEDGRFTAAAEAIHRGDALITTRADRA
ncbi:MAG TPA: methyltransferase [Lichenihabitans sp.]|nr:methyltransferase [Lichenihabitans sp.]